MKFNLAACCLFGLVLATVGCGKPEKNFEEIDVDAAQAHYDDWSAARIKQIEADPNLSDAQKKKQIEEIKDSAKGQMSQVQGLADGEADERKRGQ
ncbi:MAG: hypothetical protein AAGG44_16935 [Planctomycetota bacterium]